MARGIGGEVAWWCPSLDDAGNGTTTLNDLAGTNHGTLTNMDAATDWVSDTGSGGIRALDFDGINDHVSVPPLLSSTFSLSIWVNAAAQSDRRFFAFGNSASTTPAYAFGTGVLSSTSRVRVFIRDASIVTRLLVDSSTIVFNSLWHHLAWVDVGGNAKLFVDGVQDASDFSYSPTAISFNLSSIGAWLRATVVSPFDGMIDDVRVFNRELTQQEITALATKRGYQKPAGLSTIIASHHAALGI